jgi:hypothetical protein
LERYFQLSLYMSTLKYCLAYLEQAAHSRPVLPAGPHRDGLIQRSLPAELDAH